MEKNTSSAVYAGSRPRPATARFAAPVLKKWLAKSVTDFRDNVATDYYPYTNVLKAYLSNWLSSDTLNKRANSQLFDYATAKSFASQAQTKMNDILDGYVSSKNVTIPMSEFSTLSLIGFRENSVRLNDILLSDLPIVAMHIDDRAKLTNQSIEIGRAHV